MQIDIHKVVTLNYTLKDEDGSLIDQSNDSSFVYLHGASNRVAGRGQGCQSSGSARLWESGELFSGLRSQARRPQAAALGSPGCRRGA